MTDVASRNPEVVAQLLRLMDQAHMPSDSYPLFMSEKQLSLKRQ